MTKLVMPFNKICNKDVALVGGKNASLGEMLSKTGVPVPDGFAVTSNAYKYFIKYNHLDKIIRRDLKKLHIKNMKSLQKTGKIIRNSIRNGKYPKKLEKEIVESFEKLGAQHVAVRSSATAEDLPTASFAGLQESFLNVSKKELLEKIKACFASLFTDRAISYREDKGFDHFKVFISVGVQRQVFSQASGVMFTLEPDSGHPNFIYINGGWGLGDLIVQGRINPDQFLVLKHKLILIEKKKGNQRIMEVRCKEGVKTRSLPSNLRKKFVLTDNEVKELAAYGKKIEKHYKTPMDIEWAKDSDSLHIIQARPETVHSQRGNIFYTYKLREKGILLATGEAVGRQIISGRAMVLRDAGQIRKFKKDCILVTKQTDPDWEPILKIAKGVVTDEGGKTSHAAIVSRELGIPAVVGSINGTQRLRNKKTVTLDCSTDTGKVWAGIIKFTRTGHDLKKMMRTKKEKSAVKIYVNIGEPDNALNVGQLPVDGVGLARTEFIINDWIGKHPLYLLSQHKERFFVERLSTGVAKLAAAFYPRPVIVRFSDFKSNEYRKLEGGEKFEPVEENPMLGWRGAARFVSPQYQQAFRLECKAMKKAIGMGLDNIWLMVPFCRTVEEGRTVKTILKEEGLGRIRTGIMAEIPSNIILAKYFAKYFDFFSIGSNDLTQLTLGADRDNYRLAKDFDERNPAVKEEIRTLIHAAHDVHRKVSICGDAPSTYRDYASFLIKEGIDSISVSPDVALETLANIRKK